MKEIRERNPDANLLQLPAVKDIALDYKLAYRYGRLHCTVEECAYAYNVSLDFLLNDNRFLHAYRRGWESGKRGLRRLQWDQARKGNVQMLIWLGKQFLQQSDQVTTTNNTTAVVTHNHNLKGLSTEDLLHLRSIMEKAEATVVDVKAVEVEVKEE